MNFIAIDFETANNQRASACSLGLAVVENNVVVDDKYWLIRPEPLTFSPFNTAIHGITEDDVKDAPTFQEIWPELESYVNHNLVAAHNASFDISVLRRTIEYYNLKAPDINILCSYRLSKAALPGLWSHRLNLVSESLDIPLRHHRADSDAIACAEIICRLSNQEGIKTVGDLKKRYSVQMGYWHRGLYYEPCRVPCESSSRRTGEPNLLDSTKCIDEDFQDKNYAFTGTLLSMPREKAFEVVTRGGGTAQKGLTKKTDVLVVGIQDYARLKGATESSKMRKAREMQECGLPIKVIGEDEFIQLIDDDLYKLCFHNEMARSGLL